MELLSFEQQFSIASFQQQAQEMSREQAIDMLINTYRQLLLQQNSYKELLKHSWGIATSPEINQP